MELKFDRNKIIEKLKLEVKAALERGAIDLETHVKDLLNRNASNIGNGGIASPEGEPPANNTGTLMRSITHIDKTTDPMKPAFQVGTNVVYAKIQEYGGRIRAKKGKFLAVPIGIEGRRTARNAKGDIRSLNLVLIRTPAGKLLLCKVMPRYVKPLFILLKSVVLPARPFMRPAYADKKGPIGIRVELAIKGVLKGAA